MAYRHRRARSQIEVTFDIDANGILTVSAKDKATNKAQSVKIEASTSLNKDEIEKLKKEVPNMRRKTRRSANSSMRRTRRSRLSTQEKGLKDAGDKVPADVKEDVNAKIAKIKEIQEGSDVARITAA